MGNTYSSTSNVLAWQNYNTTHKPFNVNLLDHESSELLARAFDELVDALYNQLEAGRILSVRNYADNRFPTGEYAYQGGMMRVWIPKRN
jgi:hypothetical protein